jgi:hypothetical protein
LRVNGANSRSTKIRLPVPDNKCTPAEDKRRLPPALTPLTFVPASRKRESHGSYLLHRVAAFVITPNGPTTHRKAAFYRCVRAFPFLLVFYFNGLFTQIPLVM